MASGWPTPCRENYLTRVRLRIFASARVSTSHILRANRYTGIRGNVCLFYRFDRFGTYARDARHVDAMAAICAGRSMPRCCPPTVTRLCRQDGDEETKFSKNKDATRLTSGADRPQGRRNTYRDARQRSHETNRPTKSETGPAHARRSDRSVAALLPIPVHGAKL